MSLIARVNSEIVGFIIGRIEITRGTLYGHIITLETLPSYRRRGVAEKLLRALEALFSRKGATESRLEVREDNIVAINLYQKLGYKSVAKLEGYYGTAHGLYLQKNLRLEN
jgi:ribosomal protein S18 acetylase RimI-like enzyme